MSGTLYGLGVGPGDPELITLKALRIIEAAPVIAYPAPDKGDSLARAIAEPHIPDGKTEIAVRTPMVPGAFPAHDVYDHYAGEIGDHLSAGRDVAVLCEGDPFLYGSFMYLFARLAGEHETKVVPGVSSLGACAAAAGVPTLGLFGPSREELYGPCGALSDSVRTPQSFDDIHPDGFDHRTSDSLMDGLGVERVYDALAALAERAKGAAA